LSAFNRDNCAIAGAQKQPGNFLVEFMDINSGALALGNIMYRDWRGGYCVLSQQVLNKVLNFTVSGSQWFHADCLGGRSLYSLHPLINGGHFGNAGIHLRADGLPRTRRWEKLGSRHSERVGDVHELNSRYSAQVYVGDQARRPAQPIRLQKLFSGRKYFGDKAKRLQQALQRLAG
jgi:hypothetical protein